ncbi:TrbI/VirB10 family protein [Sphingomonas sp. PB4P5]|uniref:TrbI/VirB10 family protein n=1 Tax=Parasphingomonas puruogangriensis TaxID=3096155 RepID=UPI002FC68DAA
MVAHLPRGLPWWLIAGGVTLAAILLFVLLDTKRRSLTAPATKVRASDAYARAAAPSPMLFVPPEPVVLPPAPFMEPRQVPITPSAPPPAPQVYQPLPMPQPLPVDVPLPSPPPAAGNNASALVFDSTQAEAVASSAPLTAGASAVAASGRPGGSERARATMMRQRPTTVPQGTLIPAVLETALDSTRPGLVRALVQRDVRGFDGTKVLIGRGSRLIGEYGADLRSGQNRASVMWSRLVRPDGVTIALNSPAADTLGRGGIRGKVNTHFLARFGAAILQSTLDLGVNLASRVGNNNNSVVVGVPLGSGAQQIFNNNQVQPTLTVRQGTTIMVFVARDLDFTDVETIK